MARVKLNPSFRTATVTGSSQPSSLLRFFLRLRPAVRADRLGLAFERGFVAGVRGKVLNRRMCKDATRTPNQFRGRIRDLSPATPASFYANSGRR